MNETQQGASSFIQNDQLFVIRGGDVGMFRKFSSNERWHTIKKCNLNRLPLNWVKLSVIPYRCIGHKTVVCRQQVLYILKVVFNAGPLLIKNQKRSVN